MKRINEVLEKYKDCLDIAIFCDDGEEITYKRLYEESLSLSRRIVNYNTNVLVFSHNKIDFAIAIFAVWFANKTVVPIDVRLTNNEIKNIADFCESNVMLVERNIILNDLDIDIVKIENITCDISNSQMEFKNNDLALICPTTGTTNNPKFVMLTHANLIAESHDLKYAYDFTKITREIILVPLTSITGCVGQLIGVLYSGGSLVLYNGSINPIKICRIINDYEVNIIVCTPSILSLITNFVDLNLESFRSIKTIIVAGEKTSKGRMENFINAFPNIGITQVYGLTEVSSSLSGHSIDKKAPIDSVGKALPSFTIKILDSQGDECKPFISGEIVVQGPAVTVGYYKNKSLTNKVLTNGWFNTGDLGYKDNNGYLYINGRLKNIVIIGGQNVHVEEIEEYILKNNNIENTRVYSMPNSVTGEMLIAEVVPKVGCCITETEISNFLKKGLSSFKIPKRIIVKDSLELTEAGKVKRR